MVFRFYLTLIFVLSIYIVGQCQSIEDLVVQPRIHCDDVAANSIDLIEQYHDISIDSLRAIEGIWLVNCPSLERSMRFSLVLDLLESDIDTDKINEYYQQHLHRFRYLFSPEVDQERGWTSYRHAESHAYYDLWTQSVALDLIEQYEFGDDEYLLCLLFSGDFRAFDKALRKKPYRNLPVKNHDDAGRGTGLFVLGIDYWSPIGKAADIFNPSPRFKLGYGGEVHDKVRVDLSVAFTRWLDRQELDFSFADVDYTTDGVNQFAVGFTGNYNFWKKDRVYSDLTFGLAADMLMTDIDSPNEDESNYSVGTLGLNLGATLRREFAYGASFGWTTSLHFAPYGINDRVVTDVGMLYLTTGVQIRL